MTLATDRQNQPPLQGLPQPVSFDEFIAGYPENSEFRYELHHGVIIEMPKPRGTHSSVGGAAAKRLNYAIDAAELDYLIPLECVIKISDHTGYQPDVVVLEQAALVTEPRWESASTVEQASSIKLVIEIVSTNWQNDYELKMTEYEMLGIAEYWMIDYAGLGGIRHLGKPKQPTLTIATLVDGEYETCMFRGAERLVSLAFPNLSATAAELMRLN
jgi:Uma2 family endonuclease